MAIKTLNLKQLAKNISINSNTAGISSIPNSINILSNDVKKESFPKNMHVKGAQLFTVNYNYASKTLKEVYDNYSKYIVKAKKLTIVNTASVTTVDIKTGNISCGDLSRYKKFVKALVTCDNTNLNILVSVIHKECALADAIATGLIAMNTKDIIDFSNKKAIASMHVIKEKDNIKKYYSDEFIKFLKNN